MKNVFDMCVVVTDSPPLMVPIIVEVGDLFGANQGNVVV